MDAIPDLPAPVEVTSNPKDDIWDGVVLVCENLDWECEPIDFLKKPIKHAEKVDKSVGQDVLLFPLKDGPPFVVHAPTGPVNRDYDDVRRYADAAVKGIQRAVKAGSRSPLLVVPPSASFPDAWPVTVLGVFHGLYVPIEIREDVPDRKQKVDKVGVFLQGTDANIDYVSALESGRLVCRDIGGSDPERMAAPNVESYIHKLFKGTSVKNGVLLSRIIAKYCSVSTSRTQEEASDIDILKGILEAADSQLGVPSCIVSSSRLLDGTIDEYTLLIYLAILRRKVSEKKGEECYKGGGSPIKQRTPQNTPVKSPIHVLKTPPTSVNEHMESPLSPTTLKNLVEQQTKSHEAIQALQAKLQAINYQPITPKLHKQTLPRAGTQDMPPVFGLSCQADFQQNSNELTPRIDCNDNELNASVANHSGDIKSIYSSVDKHFLDSMLDVVQGYMLPNVPQSKTWLNAEEDKTSSSDEKQDSKISQSLDSTKTSQPPESSMPEKVKTSDVVQIKKQETVDKHKASEILENGDVVDVISSEVAEAKPSRSHTDEILNATAGDEGGNTETETSHSTPKSTKQVKFSGLDTVFAPPEDSSPHNSTSGSVSPNTTAQSTTDISFREYIDNEMGNNLELSGTKGGLDYPVVSNDTVTWASLNSSCASDKEKGFEGQTDAGNESNGSIIFDDENDQFMMYLNSIEQTALKFKLQVEQAKIDTLQILKSRLEQAYEGTPLEEIPAKVHEKLQETIAQIATEEVKKYESVLHVDYKDEFVDEEECGILKQMRAELDSLAAENFRLHTELEASKRYEKDYHALQGKIEGMEDGLTTMKHDYATKNGESEFLGKRIEALEQEMVSMRVEYEEQIRELQNENIELQKECLELDNENRNLEDELKKIQVGLSEQTFEADAYESKLDDNLADKITAAELEVVETRVNELERHNKALKASSEADHAMVVCMEKKVEDLEGSLSEAKTANSNLLAELHESQRQQATDRAKLTSYKEELDALKRENKFLKCSLESSETEVQYQKKKNEQRKTSITTRSPGSLGNKREIWNEIRELETILKDVQKEKKTIERKYQAFRQDSNDLSSSYNSATMQKSPLNPSSFQEGSPNSTLGNSYTTTPRSKKTSSLLDRVNSLLDKSSPLPNGTRTDSLTSPSTNRVSATLDRDAGRSPTGELLSPRSSSSLGRTSRNPGLSEELASLRSHVGSLEAEKASILRELSTIRTPTKDENTIQS